MALAGQRGNENLLLPRQHGRNDKSRPRGRQRDRSAGSGRVSYEGRDRAQALGGAAGGRGDGTCGESQQKVGLGSRVRWPEAVPRCRWREEQGQELDW